MGHVHLSKLKFRHPVPDVFSPWKSVHTEQARQGKETMTQRHPDFMVSYMIYLHSMLLDKTILYSCFQLAYVQLEL